MASLSALSSLKVQHDSIVSILSFFAYLLPFLKVVISFSTGEINSFFLFFSQFSVTSTVAELQSELTSSTSEIDQSRSTTTSSSSVVVKQTSQSAKSTIFSKTTSTSKISFSAINTTQDNEFISRANLGLTGVAGQATHQTSKEPSETTRSRSEFDLSTTSAQLHSDVPSSTSKLAPSDFTTSPKGTVSVLSSTESEAVASTSNVISEKTDSNSGSVTSATTTNPEGTLGSQTHDSTDMVMVYGKDENTTLSSLGTNVTTISGTDGTATTVEFKDPSRTSAASSATGKNPLTVNSIPPPPKCHLTNEKNSNN